MDLIDDNKATRLLDDFKQEAKSMSASEYVQKRILHGGTYIFSDDIYYDLRREVAQHFNVHPLEVVMVGSGKLGFTTHDKYDKETGKLTRPRFSLFYDQSDIDLAIVSNSRFDEYWIDIHYHVEQMYRTVDTNLYRYMFNGWIRPDQIPFDVKLRKDWFDYFEKVRAMREFGGFKLTAGIYKDWYFLESYQAKSVDKCKRYI